ncbi:MAG: hypothetical protein ACXVAV_16165 [Ktedonobacteraceae bacterium]
MSMVVQLIAESLTPAIFCDTHSEGLSEYLSVRIALRRAKLTGRSGDKAGCSWLLQRDVRSTIDSCFDSNQCEVICIDLNGSEERHSLIQRRERNEGPQATRYARPKTL